MVIHRSGQAAFWRRQPAGTNEQEWQNYLTQNLNTSRRPGESRTVRAVRRHIPQEQRKVQQLAAAGVRRNHGECAFLPVNLLAFSDPRTARGRYPARVPRGSFAYDCSRAARSLPGVEITDSHSRSPNLPRNTHLLPFGDLIPGR